MTALCSSSESAIIFDPGSKLERRLEVLGSVATRHPTAEIHRVYSLYFGGATSFGYEPALAEVDAGRLWLRSGLTLLDLYVPDVPLDPAVERYCALKLQAAKRSRLEREAEVAIYAETAVTGTSKSLLIDSLKKALSDLPTPSDGEAELSDYERRVHDISGFYQETHRFFATVHRSVNLIQLETAVIDGRLHALQEEENFQSASQAYLTRISASYPSLQDLIRPIAIGIRASKVGMHILAKAIKVKAARGQSPIAVRTVDDFVTFPSVVRLRHMIDYQNTLAASISSRSGSQTLLALEACKLLRNADCRFEMIGGQVGRAYQTMIALWLADQNTNRRAEQVTQSLYRERKVQYEDLPDAEREAKELLAMFPQYEVWDAEDDDSLVTEVGQQQDLPSSSTFLTHADVIRLYQLHLQLFQDDVDRTHSFEAARIDAVAQAVQEHPDAFSSALDSQSAPLRVAMLAQRRTAGSIKANAEEYNFYNSPNLPEMAKVLDFLGRLDKRVRVILEEFPDQMVLQHLLDRCDNIRAIGATSPVARILAAMEQLLTHTEDWQAYANRDNTLKPFQEEIIQMIISWRRLELSGWTHLLNQEARSYESDTAEWWFRLYQLLILGTVGDEDEPQATDGVKRDHMAQALPLLLDYLASSTMGRFSSRLRLLRSFRTLIARTPELEGRDSMQRTARILASVLRRFGQFESKIEDFIRQKRQPLDKAITDFVKLATWKDINIESMRASARKTHAQLYKSIRNFREILKQPISVVLQAGPPAITDEAEDAYQHEASVATDSPVLPNSRRPEAIDSVPLHLIQLDKTYKKFSGVMKADHASSIDEAYIDLDDLVDEIRETSKALQEETPSSLTEENKKLVGNLQARKRKAFADLLKALRGLGFSAKNRADQLANQSSSAWLCNLPGLVEESMDCIPEIRGLLQSAESYHHRLDILLPDMRESLRNHSEDFVTQDLQRAHGFADNVFAAALKYRSRCVMQCDRLCLMTS